MRTPRQPPINLGNSRYTPSKSPQCFIAIAVYVHPDQQPAGMPLVAVGALTAARRMAAMNVGLLVEAVRQCYHIVATEPSAALCVTHEYPILLDDDARLVAQHTSDACAYIWHLHMKLLALAYGTVPDAAKLLTTRGEELFVT